MADQNETSSNARFFPSPRTAVSRIATMLRNKAWPELASYYDLAGTGIDRADLESGVFFVRETRPESAHPGGFWRYRHPFAPSFQFETFIPVAGQPGVFDVMLSVEIDQGGGMIQRGRTQFQMRENEQGY